MITNNIRETVILEYYYVVFITCNRKSGGLRMVPFIDKKLQFIIATALLFPAITTAQALETEESAPLRQFQVEMGTGLEFQTSGEGTETALPMAFEFGVLDNLTFLVEPVGFTSINPKGGQRAVGAGDLEMTLFYQVFHESAIAPSISLAGEVKLPTARNRSIGSGKTDYTPFVVASKSTGPFFTSLNLGYSFIGKPQGVNASDQFNYALGTIFTVTPRNHLYAEIYGNTAATELPETASTTSGAAELSGGELVGAIAYGHVFLEGLEISLGLSYDNNNAVLIRPGLEWKFGGK